MSAVSIVPRALLRDVGDLPMVRLGPGVSLQLLQVDLDHNIRVTRVLFEPGLALGKHKHTGHVHAWTLSGSWKYTEYPEVNVAGSYLFEPAGAAHTLVVPANNAETTEVLFVVHGSNLELDADDSIRSVTDARGLCELYLRTCKELGLPRPDVIGLPATL